MLSCICRFFGCKIPLKRSKIGSNSVANNYPNLLVPQNGVDISNTCLVYDSVKALLQADKVVYKRSEEIIESFILKFDSGFLTKCDIDREPPREFKADHVSKLLTSVLNSSSVHPELSAKIELLFNITKYYTKNRKRGEPNDIENSLNIFFKEIYKNLFEQYVIQASDNLEFIKKLTKADWLKSEITDKVTKMNDILKNIKKFDMKLLSPINNSGRFNGKDLRQFVSLREIYNNHCFKHSQKISELGIILSCYSIILEEAENMERKKNNIGLRYKGLNTCLTNIIVYSFKFLSLYLDCVYEVAFARCMTPTNFINFHKVKSTLIFYKKIDFFSFDYKNIQFLFFVRFIRHTNLYCEEITPGSDYRITNVAKMSDALSMFDKTVKKLLELNSDLVFDQNVRENYNLFLLKPEHVKFQKRKFQEMFTMQQLEDMLLFGMFTEEEVENITFDEPENMNNEGELDTNIDRSQTDMASTTGECLEGTSFSGLFGLTMEELQHDLNISYSH